MILSGKFLFHTPVVYVVKRGGVYLYIGMANGFLRMSRAKGPVVKALIRHDDTLEVIEAADIESARLLRLQMIKRYQPIWNIQGIKERSW
jgi:excinuclease UvrABC nuclease subunit